MVAWQDRVTNIPIAEAIANCRAVDPEDTLVKTAKGLGICLGDRSTLKPYFWYQLLG